MILRCFTIYDSKAELYLPPFYFTTIGQAIRAFTNTVNTGDTEINRHPADFTLFDIGTFDNCTGLFQDEKHVSLGTGVEHLNQAHSQMPQLFDNPEEN